VVSFSCARGFPHSSGRETNVCFFGDRDPGPWLGVVEAECSLKASSTWETAAPRRSSTGRDHHRVDVASSFNAWVVELRNWFGVEVILMALGQGTLDLFR